MALCLIIKDHMAEPQSELVKQAQETSPTTTNPDYLLYRSAAKHFTVFKVLRLIAGGSLFDAAFKITSMNINFANNKDKSGMDGEALMLLMADGIIDKLQGDNDQALETPEDLSREDSVDSLYETLEDLHRLSIDSKVARKLANEHLVKTLDYNVLRLLGQIASGVTDKKQLNNIAIDFYASEKFGKRWERKLFMLGIASRDARGNIKEYITSQSQARTMLLERIASSSHLNIPSNFGKVA